MKKEENKNVGIIGSRQIPPEYFQQIAGVTEYLIDKGYRVATGGALGVDAYCMQAVLDYDLAQRCTIYSAWRTFYGFPQKVRKVAHALKQYGSSIIWGFGAPEQSKIEVKTALLARNQRLVEACYGLVAFIHNNSKGTLFTLGKALAKQKTVVIFSTGGPLPSFKNIKWKKLSCSGCWEGGYKAVYLK